MSSLQTSPSGLALRAIETVKVLQQKAELDIKISEFFLEKAAEDGDVMSLQMLMAYNPELLYWESVVEKNTALHIAASEGHVWFVHHFLIFMGLNCELVIKENMDGNTPLHLAVRAGHLDVVEHLIQYVAWARNMQKFLKDPLMVQNNKQNTLLHESVIHSRCNVATKLLERAKEVTLKGSTLEAIVGMHIVDAKEIVRLDYALFLLWNSKKHTPLHMAVKDNNFEMVEMLIKYDQDMKHDLILGKQIKTLMSISGGNQADVEAGVNSQHDLKILELKKAAEDGDVMSLQKLMASNPELLYWESGVEKNTALHIAASEGHVWFVHHFLIFMGLNCELVIKENMDGNTPLHLAVRAGHLDVVEHLIQYVAWARNKQIMKEPLIMLYKEGNTLLHEAVIKGLDNVVDILLEYCRIEGKWSTPKAIIKEHNEYVDHDIKISDVLKIWGPLTIGDKEGNNPLHLAAINRMSDMALKMLDDIPRSAHVPNGAMQSPLYIAVMNGLDHVINKIAKQGLSVPAISISIDHGTAVHQAVLADNIRALEILLSKYARLLEVPDKEGNSALHYAAKTNNSRMTSMLLKKDYSLAYKQNLNQRRCPLHVATEHGSLEVVKELLKQRPDVSEMVDIAGQNVFHIAVTSNRVNVLKWLLQWLPGDLVNQQDIHGYTPLHFATTLRLVEQASLLLRDPRVDPCIANREGDTAFSISERMGIMEMTADEVKLWKKLKKHESTRCKQKKMIKQHFRQQGQGFRYTIDMRTYALVATLIAVTTFVATLKYSRLSSFANVRHRLPFKILVICNTMSMCSSTVVFMSTIWQLWKQLKVMLPWMIWASRLIVFAGFMMIMSMLTTIYLTVAPASQWLAYAVISIGITALFLYYYTRKKHADLPRLTAAAPPPRGPVTPNAAALPRGPVTPNAAAPPRGPVKEHRTAITVPELKRWLKQFDTDHEGRISKKELQKAIRRGGAWFSGLRTDGNRNRFLDDSEIEGLINFAERALGIRTTTEWAPPLPRGLVTEHRTAITVPELKRWLKQFDTDHDGRISRKELREAIRRRGAWFSGLRALFAVRRAGRNRYGFVDDSEIEGLIDFAERELGFRITTE